MHPLMTVVETQHLELADACTSLFLDHCTCCLRLARAIGQIQPVVSVTDLTGLGSQTVLGAV